MGRPVVDRYLFAGMRDTKPQGLTMAGLVLFLMTSQTALASDDSTRPVRKILTGSIQGFVHTLKSGRQVERYLGVPYAKPPVGDLRFERPVPPLPWAGILSTNSVPPACVQEKKEKTYILTHNPDYDGRMSEDCLYINIYVPLNSSTEMRPLPVLIHVHGGSNMVGMGAMFHGDVLASEGDFIVITLNYRLGPFGFLYMPEYGLFGNYGLHDQNLAFRWVKDNIASFGGDPERITVQGHSAGSVDVGLHVISPMAAGLFQSAILQSGSPTSYWAVTFDAPDEDNVERRKRNLKLVECDGRNQEETLVCLRQLTYTKLCSTTFHYKNRIYNFSPAIDGQYIPHHPIKLLARMTKGDDLRPNCDTIMMGVTNDEGSLTADVVVKHRLSPLVRPDTIDYVMPPEDLDLWMSIPDDEFKGFKDLVQYIYTPWETESNPTTNIIAFSDFCGDLIFTAPAIRLANDLSKVKGTDIFVYNFNHVSQHTSYPWWMGAPHGEDQFYLFGSPIEGHALHNYTREDKVVSQQLIRVWSHFIHHRNLTLPDGSLFVPPYTSLNEHYMEIHSKGRSDTVLETKQRLRKPYTAFWNNLLPKLKSTHSSHTEQSEDRQYILWIVVALLCLFVILSIVLLSCLIRSKRDPPTKPLKNHVAEDSGNNLL